jgi:hypothetical protein
LSGQVRQFLICKKYLSPAKFRRTACSRTIIRVFGAAQAGCDMDKAKWLERLLWILAAIGGLLLADALKAWMA